MAARNEHTCKMITTAIRTTTDAYREGWDRIFGKKKPQEHLVSPDIADGNNPYRPRKAG